LLEQVAICVYTRLRNSPLDITRGTVYTIGSELVTEKMIRAVLYQVQ